MTVNVFAVPVFFIVFRETIETGIIVAVLLAFLKQTLDGPNRDVATYKKLNRQVKFSPNYLKSANNQGLVWRCEWFACLLDRWRWSDRRLLWLEERQMGKYRELLGRLLCHFCVSGHWHYGCCASPCLQNARKVASQACQSLRGKVHCTWSRQI